MIDKVKKAMLCMTRQCWEQGIVASALYDLKDWYSLELVVLDMMNRQSSDGRLCNVENTPAVTDSSFCVPATFLLGKKNHNQDMLHAAERNMKFLLHDAERAEDGTLFHMIHTGHVWADSAAYLPYSMALMGHPKEALKQMQGICKRLYDPKSGLYFHMWDEETKSYIRPLPWGVGNGWILSGMVRLYGALNDTKEIPDEERKELADEIVRLTDTLLKQATSEYRFYDILDSADSFLESEVSALIAYSIYKSVGLGILDAVYLEQADKIRIALEAKVQENGLVIDAAGSPDFVRPGTAVECQANFIMMQVAYYRVKEKRHL